MTFGRTLLGILGMLAVFGFLAGQVSQAAVGLSFGADAEHCDHHAAESPTDCPADQACCHGHPGSLAALEAGSWVPGVPVRAAAYFSPRPHRPEGCVREIDLPPQLS